MRKYSCTTTLRSPAIAGLWNVWNACAGFGSEAAHGFSDDREVSQYRVVGHRCVLLGAQAGRVLLTSVDGVDDVGEALFV